MSIPVPLTRFTTLHELQLMMQSTHGSDEQFRQFKRNIRTYSRRYLDFPKSKMQQTRAKWARFVRKILHVDPTLDVYEEQWPIEQYYHSFSKYYRSPQSLDASDAHVQVSLPQPTEILVIESSRESSPEIFVSEKVLQRPSVVRQRSPGDLQQEDKYCFVIDIPRPDTPVHTIPAYYAQRFQRLTSEVRNAWSSPAQNSPSSTPPRLELIWDMEFRTKRFSTSSTVTAACCLCGPPAEVDSFLNSSLSHFINDVALLDILASLGVCFDQHLEVLLRFDNARRIQFLNLFPVDRVSALTKLKLLNTLKQHTLNYSDVSPNNNQPTRCVQISCPGPAVEEAIIQSNAICFSQELRLHMQLESECDIFDELLSTMEKQSREFFVILDPKIERLRGTIRRIIAECPRFARYIDYWPIRLYLQHRQFCMGGMFPQYGADEELEAFTTVFDQEADVHNNVCGGNSAMGNTVPNHPGASIPFALKPAGGQKIEQIPCKTHPPIDTTGCSLKMRAHLEAFGMGELLPSLVRVGVYTDDDFATLLQLCPEDRTNLLVKFGKIQLSELQKFMLDLAFDCGH